MLIYAGIFVLLVAITAFFNLAEMALVVARPERLQAHGAASSGTISLVLKIKENPGAFLSATQSGNTITSILAGTFCVTAFAETLAQALSAFPVLDGYAGAASVVISLVAASYLTLVLGELLPKRIAIAAPERCALIAAHPMNWVMTVFRPFISFLLGSNNAVLHILGVSATRNSETTEDEIRYVIASGLKSGTLKAAEHDMLESILQLGTRSARTIMTSRRDLEWVDVDMPEDEVRRRVAESPCSKLIVTLERDLDRPLGVVAKKDFLRNFMRAGEIEFRAIAHPPVFVPDTSTVLGMLGTLKRARAQMLFVVDEFGSVAGIVTLTDVLEAVAGDVPEPERQARTDETLIRSSDGTYAVAGSVPADDLAEYLGLRDDGPPGYKTVAGLVLAKLKHLPHPGEQVTLDGWTIEVVDVDGRTIQSLRLIPPRGDKPTPGGSAEAN
ncbi:Putative Mg2+ and Co2+ transporter CorB [Achromobacter xylosoxidans]|uniref:hemolysin family protein n=1 Tax=Alcaligenes xylosoxydans xylosoxydans TaxID=85698 RepID=UPI0006C2924D|nr:hemolysin family protein [Achromobacter xylosoxidans]CUJ03126.1 Putative Mg2+ and Co2+ transporter CorB [Achromobacter xylosoxidans]CUJ19753.1 Putative Mg2+ and Co2+ transporter CorB [Achromobacter xylosoxidans]